MKSVAQHLDWDNLASFYERVAGAGISAGGSCEVQ